MLREDFGKMAQIGVADFQGCLGDVPAFVPQEMHRPLHADHAQIGVWWHAVRLGEDLFEFEIGRAHV